MIIISCIFETTCKVLFEVDPIRPARIDESELGEAIAKKSTDYIIGEDKKIYRSISSIRLDHPIERLKEMQVEIQEEFSKKIQQLKNKVDEFNLLKELTKKKEIKK